MIENASLEQRTDALADKLVTLLGNSSVIIDVGELAFLSSDVYSAGVTAAIAIRPADRALIPDAIRHIGDGGFAIVPRGGGMSYTSGYTPIRADSVIVDLGGLDRIVSIDRNDMIITVEAGVTWQQIFDALNPLGLRLPFFGTFSGNRATVGGGMSNGALFMGTGRYGTAAEIALGFEVVTAKGRLLRTGQAAFKNGKPFYRTYGPDLTGLFVHDAGALGVKTLVSMRLMEAPSRTDYASFVYDNMNDAAKAMSEIARAGVAEEAYVFDPESTRRSLDAGDLRQDLKRLLGVMKSQGSLSRGVREGIKLVGAGRNFIDKDVFSLHVVVSGSCEEAVVIDLARVRAIADQFRGGEIANSIPKAARANPFEPLNGILGAEGDRWAALNCKVAHSDAEEIIGRTDAILAKYDKQMSTAEVTCSRLCIAISNHAFSFEPVLRWNDEWLPVHRRTPEPEHLAKLTEPAPNPVARALVHEIRAEIVAMFAEFGAASNQIGKTYAYFESMNPETAALIVGLKKSLDPDGLMNPGALGLPG
ncbi:MAG: FAD-binding oxidoreductase [Woeseiaceae bacterium]